MKKIIFFTFIVLTLFTGCENKAFFELERPIQNPWTTLSDFDRAPIGAYNKLFSVGGYGDIFSTWYLYKNAEADDVSWLSAGDSWGYFRDSNSQKQFLPQVFTLAYQVICSTNDALQFLDDNNGNPYPNLSDNDKTYNLNRIVGELYFLRGFAYYMNATVFCDAYVPGGANDTKQIPLLTKRASDYQGAINTKIGTVKEVWAQIQSDFEKAYQLLPERYIAGKMSLSYQAGRANKFAAAAMLARTHFAMGDYAKAKGYTDYIIDQNGSDYNLNEDPIQAFNKIVLGRGSEVIMYIPNYDQTTAQQIQLMGAFNSQRGNLVNAWNECNIEAGTLKRLGWLDNPALDINATFNMAALRDKRFTQLMAVREPISVPVANQYLDRYYKDTRIKYTVVFANKAFRGAPVGSNAAWYTNIPVIRLAEMYLTRSICRFKAGDKAGAASDLNVVRKRAWDATVAKQSYESSSNFVTESNITEQMIGDERLIEMFCEGDRIDYLRGMKTNVGNGERGPGSVPYTDKGFVWAVPTTETDLNLGYH
jgi:tetratricopeptide (TPR) repeat protein